VTEPSWLRVDFAIEANKRAVSKTGEHHALLRSDALESAFTKPRHHFQYGGEEDIATLACVLLFGIARNHPFEQGNKRTALACALLGEQLVAVLTGALSEGDFGSMFASHVTEIEDT